MKKEYDCITLDPVGPLLISIVTGRRVYIVNYMIITDSFLNLYGRYKRIYFYCSLYTLCIHDISKIKTFSKGSYMGMI